MIVYVVMMEAFRDGASVLGVALSKTQAKNIEDEAAARERMDPDCWIETYEVEVGKAYEAWGDGKAPPVRQPQEVDA